MPNNHLPLTVNHLPFKNPNLRFAALFVDGLAQAGLESVVISPGSRSTPLTLAFEAHPGIETFLHIDERGAGFYALGMALASDKPVALICTSGTAVANYLPTIIEAQMSQVPLLILTGDRPHELRHSGANQTIDQVKIFGDQVLWSVDMPLPQEDVPEVALRHVQTTAVRAYATANGLRKGPVHVNFPFRKPLEPSAEEIRAWRLEIESATPISNLQSPISRGKIMPTDEQLDWLTAVLTHHPRGLIICGPRCPGGDFPAAVTALAQQTGYPLLADPLSGVRFFNRGGFDDEEKKSAKSVDNLSISGYETFLQHNPGWPEPEMIVRFGQVPTSKWLNAYLDKIQPAIRLHIRESGVWADDSQRTTHFWQMNETAVCQTLTARLENHQPNPTWHQTIYATEKAAWDALESQLHQHWFDGPALPILLDQLPENANILIGNSLPVRHLDQYGRSRPKTLHIFGNRGASGIDGNIATGLGLATATKRPTFIVVGDITALHDLNSLLLARQTPNATIIVLNNNGGGIFRRLPISQHEPPFTDRFLTPHGRTFAHAAAMFELDYILAENRESFVAAVETAVAHPAPRLIELLTDGAQDEQIRRQINQLLKEGNA
ncbi:2-succinyl-5-enolpyruvyl-6-hydroxy-3-cyclohexene-1-carboxylic-acid synthase [Candidatus Leptofilum sp.]|uniref:2-succinyl-5-enolpyruvyl-6-hydroxy-3- cyclohexene-1-carboxylic-acid synthase n=1 Tax=Candidatus Leptofilum sp. TaxID=3241576 RepID=UPI003B5A0DEC